MQSTPRAVASGSRACAVALRKHEVGARRLYRSLGDPQRHMYEHADVIAAHKHSFKNKFELMQSDKCGCFYCFKVFPPKDLVEYVDEVDGECLTALCPYCGIDSVIGSASGYPIEVGFLQAMSAWWFT